MFFLWSSGLESESYRYFVVQWRKKRLLDHIDFLQIKNNNSFQSWKSQLPALGASNSVLEVKGTWFQSNHCPKKSKKNIELKHRISSKTMGLPHIHTHNTDVPIHTPSVQQQNHMLGVCTATTATISAYKQRRTNLLLYWILNLWEFVVFCSSLSVSVENKF